MPAALLPVVDRNVDAIRVLQRAGVDYSKLHYRGATAIDFARQTGDDALLRALAAKDHTLYAATCCLFAVDQRQTACEYLTPDPPIPQYPSGFFARYC